MSFFNQVLAEQGDLDTLTAARQPPSPEICPWNDNYGNAWVLKKYAGYPTEKPLQALLPHGMYMDDGEVFVGERQSGYTTALSWPPYRDAAYEDAGFKVVPCAAPYLYAQAITPIPTQRPEPAGTLFFPVHSTRFVQRDADFAQLADELASLPPNLHPIAICAHWFDYADGKYAPFVARGFRLVSCGHLSDRMFLRRLRVLFSCHTYAGSNHPGTNLLYAVSSGLPYFILGDSPKLAALDPRLKYLEEEYPRWEARLSQLRDAFAEPRPDITPDQTEMVDFYVRRSAFLSPADLRKLLNSLGP